MESEIESVYAKIKAFKDGQTARYLACTAAHFILDLYLYEGTSSQEKRIIFAQLKKGIDPTGPDSVNEREDARKETAEKGIIKTWGISNGNVTKGKSAKRMTSSPSPHAIASERGPPV